VRKRKETTEIARGPPRPGGGYHAPADATEKRSRFEVYSWVFMRVSGVILLFMALYHLYWWNLVVGVEHLSAELVLERWNQPLWRLFNIGLATFAMLHGLNGARYSVEDYIRNERIRRPVKYVLYAIVLGALAWAVFALLTFDFSRATTR
jgi:succinate dehydrogenase / fumarate reductase, membrane anchor subunit